MFEPEFVDTEIKQPKVVGGEEFEGHLPLNELKTTKKGYIRLSWEGENRMLHNLVWEKENGSIPEGYQIHHKNGNKTDNRIENLELVDPLTHKRLHSGCELRDGIWFKPCKTCKEFKPCDKDHWYFSRGWINGRECKKSYIKRQVKKKQLRKV